jgi:hypothetical protein
MADFFGSEPRFNSLSLVDLLRARDQFHAHLLHKANVVGTAIGRYLIRKTDPYPKPRAERPEATATVKKAPQRPKPPRTLESSEVRDYSWPAILVFVSEWAKDRDFGVGAEEHLPTDYVPKTIYLEDGLAVPVCVVLAPRVVASPEPLASVRFPDRQISGGYPVIASVQGREHVASLGCLVTDGHKLFALTSAHVAGEAGETLSTRRRGKPTRIGTSAAKRLTKLPFERVYEGWPGRHIWVNVDVGLIEIEDQRGWSPSVFGVGTLGPLADLSIENLSLDLIGCPVRAYGCGGGAMRGRIAALFYRFRSVGGFEYVADFLIGARDETPLTTRPGDSGAVWVVDSDVVELDRSPIAIQWGGTVFDSGPSGLPFALATNLSTVCRELDLEVVRSTRYASFDYWGEVGHYTIGALACDQVTDPELRQLLVANQIRISFAPQAIGTEASEATAPGFVPLADVPDKVWKKTKGDQTPYGRRGPENPNHYADMDFPDSQGRTLEDITLQSGDLDVAVWIDYYRDIGWNKVSQRGLAPFRVWQIYKAMVEYARKQDVARYVAAAGVLAHYVGDLAQPLHSSYLTDGDPFQERDGTATTTMLGLGEGWGGGVHSAYEDDMLDAHVDDLLDALQPALAGGTHGMPLVTGGKEAGLAGLALARRSRTTLPPRDLVKAYGKLVDDGLRSEAPDRLWTKFGQETIDVLLDGCRTLAMLWESAWVEGKSAWEHEIAQSRLGRVRRIRLKGIYEDQKFVPSMALGKIAPYL